jgi:hypothetical protein
MTGNIPQTLAQIADDHVEKGVTLKFTHTWETRDGAPAPVGAPLLLVKTTRAVRDWRPPITTIMQQPGVELPDVDELNAKIPQEEWQLGLDGQPRPPWVKLFIAYLLNIRDAAFYNFANSTIGARLAVTTLEERRAWMSALQGRDVMPLVKLADRPFPTRFGERRAPDFTITGWRQWKDGVLRITDSEASNLTEVEPIPLGEMMKDEVVF